jgi:hypothetical protein
MGEANCCPADTEAGGEIIEVGRAGSSYLTHSSLGQFGSRRSLASSLPPLGVAIKVVVDIRSEEQVRRVGAFGIVAPMKNGEARRDWALVQQPTDAMRADSARSNTQAAIALMLET